MFTSLAWDNPARGPQASVMGRLRQRQDRGERGETFAAVVFAPFRSDTLVALDQRGHNYHQASGENWDLFFAGYARESESRVPNDAEMIGPAGEHFAGDWYFSTRYFDSLRATIEEESRGLWKYSHGTDFVYVPVSLAPAGDPEPRWEETVAMEMHDPTAGGRGKTLAELVRYIESELSAGNTQLRLADSGITLGSISQELRRPEVLAVLVQTIGTSLAVAQLLGWI